MKTSRHANAGLLWILALGLSLCLCIGALAETGTLFPWLTYTLDVSLVTADPEVVAFKDTPSGGVMVMVRLVADHGTIKTDDIKDSSDAIKFRDSNGQEYKPYSWRMSGIEFDSATGLFTTKAEQDGFDLLFFLEGKDESAVTGATLVVPGDAAGKTSVVALDNAPHEVPVKAVPDKNSGNTSPEDASFVLGGVRYTVSALEDEPEFQFPNRIDGKAGHLVTFSYPGNGADAETANDLLYSGARLRQPDGELIQAYCNSDNIGNPYELYFGLSDNVMLADCVFTIQSDEGETDIPLSAVGTPAAGAQKLSQPATAATAEATAEPAAEPVAEPSGEPAPVPVEERDANTFAYTVGGNVYELALLNVAYNTDEKKMAVEIVLYDHELLDFVANKELDMPFGCGIISTIDGFQYLESVTASMLTPMHLTFLFDTKNVPDLVCFGKLNPDDYAASEDFALIDPENKQFVTTFPLSALMENEKDPANLLGIAEAGDAEPTVAEDAQPAATETADVEPVQTEAAVAEPLPTETPAVALSDNAGEMEQKIADVLAQCAEGTKDAWQSAIFRAGVRNVQTDPANEGVYTFAMRSFDPGLKALGKYSQQNRQGYLEKMLENARAYGLNTSLTMEGGAFTPKSIKALQGVVKKAAAASKKAFQDKNVLYAFVDMLLYDNFAPKMKNADDLLALSDDYQTWVADHGDVLPALTPAQWTAFFFGQAKQTLDVSGGPYALALKCTAVNMANLLEAAQGDALSALSYLAYDQRWEGNRVEKELLIALANNVLSMKKRTKDLVTAFIPLNTDGKPLYGEAYPDMLAAYTYDDTLTSLQSSAEALPDYAAQVFPKAGWLSGSTGGTLVKVKAPKDSDAFYVQLRDYNTETLVVAGFVKPGTTCNLRVPKGDYYFVMASGKIWYGEENLFGSDTEITKTGLFTVLGSNYYHIVTLKVKTGGNMPIYGADEDDLR